MRVIGKIFLIVGLLCSGNVWAKVKVIDGDSLVVDGVEIRLHGIDAPEYQQPCFKADGKSYACGVAAGKFLHSIVANAQLRCQIKAVDRYKRKVAVCFANDQDVNQMMVQKGWAVAYDRYGKDYVQDQDEAKRKKIGIWQGKFMRPEFYRRLRAK